jgi:hypothetical protein
MTAVRFYFDGDRVGPLFQRAMTRQADRVRKSARQAAQDAADDIEDQGRSDIEDAGNFGSRWTDGFRATVTEGGGNLRVAVTEDVPYWRVFQNGAVIHGKPLLWIPLSFASDAQGLRASEYGGRLFRVDRKSDGLPLLLAPGKPAQPKYFGKESVTIPKKFHLLEITQRVAKKFRDYYRERFDYNG